MSAITTVDTQFAHLLIAALRVGFLHMVYGVYHNMLFENGKSVLGCNIFWKVVLVVRGLGHSFEQGLEKIYFGQSLLPQCTVWCEIYYGTLRVRTSH